MAYDPFSGARRAFKGHRLRNEFALLRERPFLLLFAARSVSTLGDSVAPIALAFAILSMPNGSGTTLGVVTAARIAAQVAFLLYGGVLADRLPRNRVMVSADLAAGVSQGLIAVLVLTGSANTLALVGLSLVSGAATALFTPASRALTVQLVAADKVQSVNATVQFSMNIGSVGGTALGGVLVAVIGAGGALAVDAGTFLLSAALLFGLRPSRRAQEQAPPPPENLFRQLAAGWRELTGRTWLWATIAQLAVVNFCIGGGFVVLGPVEADRRLGGASAWAAILTAQALGFVVGSLTATRTRPGRPLRAAVLLTLGLVPTLFCLGAGAPTAVTACAMFVSGLCVSVNDVIYLTALQKYLPEESLSRVMSYSAFGSFVFTPLGLSLAAPIADRVGLGAAFADAAALIVVSALLALAVPGVRGLRNEPAAPAEPARQ